MQVNPSKICFLADTHDLFDDRIYWKEAVSLKMAGYEVVYILASNQEEKGRTKEGITYQKIKRDLYPGSRILNYFAKRFSNKGLYSQMLKLATDERAAVYHYHDLRINRIAEKLKSLPFCPKVVYDIHEPYPENIKDYFSGNRLRQSLNNIYASYMRAWEKRKSKFCDLIITTEENIQERFKKYFPNTAVEIIYNYTNLNNEKNLAVEKKYDAIYTGGITERRGVWQILEAIKIIKDKIPEIKILFLGSWFPLNLKPKMQSFIDDHDLSENIDLLDSVPYVEVENFYRQSKTGLGIFLPIPTHQIILQIKIFEYMNFGLPIVGSNFGHIHNYIQKHNCGITVDSENPKDIADGLFQLLSNEMLYKEMSENGKEAADKYYRWSRMETKLIKIYKDLLNKTGS